MESPSEITKQYVNSLNLRREEKEEVENLIAGYMADCVAKDKMLDDLETKNSKLTKALNDIKKHQERLVAGAPAFSGTWNIADKALAN